MGPEDEKEQVAGRPWDEWPAYTQYLRGVNYAQSLGGVDYAQSLGGVDYAQSLRGVDYAQAAL
jgi:hypothetical protein